MKLAIIGSAGIPAQYGGFETLVEQLCNNQDFCQSFSKIYVFSEGSNLSYYSYHERVTIVTLPMSANGISSIFYDALSMIIAIFLRVDKALVLGVSGGLFFTLLRLFKIKIILNLDGLEWMREKWSFTARKFLYINEIAAVKLSNLLICDNQGISEYIYNKYGGNRNLAQIAYGGDQVLQSDVTKVSLPFQNYALSICRIEPENNIHVILDVFSKSPNRNLVFVGNWQASAYGTKLRETYKVYPNLLLMDAVYDPNKLSYLRTHCNLYVHGHTKGGTNPSLVEMIFYDVPIIAFDCNFNRYTLSNTEYYFRHDRELLDAISASNSIQFDPTARALIRTEYKWYSICHKYKEKITHV